MGRLLGINLLILSLICSGTWASESPVDKKLPLKLVLTEIPDTSWEFLKTSFSRESIPAWLAILSSAAVLYHYDSDIFEGTQNTGRRWGLSNSDNTKTLVRLGQYDILRVPSDTASALYFMGDGWLDFAAAGTFLAYGHFTDNARPYNTSLQMVHGIVVSAIFEQIIKRSTGRESPSDRSEPRGKWRPFPSVRAYNENTAKYDAMPSGHIMTSTLVFTVIRSNYPEYESYLLPLEIAWISVLGFAMLNNAVHWASDYPLAIGMGYAIGKSSTRLGHKDKSKNDAVASRDWSIFPGLSTDGGTSTINAIRAY